MTEEARQLTTDAAASGGFQIEPGVAFFLGGLLVQTRYVSFFAVPKRTASRLTVQSLRRLTRSATNTPACSVTISTAVSA